jgi:hypothetical protein
MTRRRLIIVASLAVVLLAAVEVTLRQWVNQKTCVQIINQSGEVMDDLIVTYAESKLPAGRLPVGQSTHVWLTMGPKGPLRIDFRQKNNGLGGFQVPDFDPGLNLRDGFKLVLVVKNNEIQRFVEDDGSLRAEEELLHRIKRWMSDEPEPAK